MEGRTREAGQELSLHLSEDDLRILQVLADGCEFADAARRLHLSESTLKRRLARIKRELGVENRVQAVVRAVREGLI